MYSDIKNLRSPESIGLLALLALLIMPGLLLFLLLFFVIQDLILILAVSFLGYVISNLAKYQLSYSKSLKLAIYASTLMVFVKFALFPFWHNLWLPLLLFLAYYIIGIVQISERKYEYRRTF